MVHYAACKTEISAPELALLFLDNVVRLHGVPEGILSDRDVRFTARFWRAFWNKLKTRLLMSTSYHPETDGQTENSNKTLETILRSVVNFEQSDWDTHLAATELAVNNSKNATTGYTPFYLNYGTDVRLPIDTALSALRPAAENHSADVSQAKWAAALAHAQENIKKAQERQSHYANQHRRKETFAIGDQVLLSCKNIRLLGDAKRTRKFTSRFIGPYRVIGINNDNAYKLELPPNLRIHPVINISQLKKYHDGTTIFPSRPPAQSRPDPEALDAHGVPSFEVERILDKRSVNRGTQYLVKWKGYPDEESTWEPISNLTGSPIAISDYEQTAVISPRPRRSNRR
jgi:hypothetical protein